MSLFILLFLLPLAHALRVVPLTQMLEPLCNADGAVNFTNVEQAVSLATMKYGLNYDIMFYKKHNDQRRMRRRTTRTAQKSLSYIGALWSGPVTVGTPAKTYSVIFDTGSTDLVLCSNSSSYCGLNGRAVYKPAKSSTSKNLHEEFTNDYADRSVTTGKVYSDKVAFGSLSASSQRINAASQYGGAVQSLNADGIVGMAYEYLSSLIDGQSFTDTLGKKLSNYKNMFGFRISDTKGVSELYLGGYNKNKMSGALTWYKVVKDATFNEYTYYQHQNSYASVGGTKVLETTSTYIIDTGTSLVLAPPDMAESFYAQVPHAEAVTVSGYSGYYSFPCKSVPKVSLSFGGSGGRHYFKPSEFNIGTVPGNTSRCMGAIVGAETNVGQNRWIVGAAFLKNQYTVFDMSGHRVGFAKIK